MGHLRPQPSAPPGWTARSPRSKRREAGEGAADRERVDLIGALVREGRLQIGRVAHDVEIACDAVRSEQRAGAPGGIERDAAVVPLEEAGLYRVELSLFLEPGVVQR